MNWLGEKLISLLGIKGSIWFCVLLALAIGVFCGWHINGWRLASSLSSVQAKFDKARQTATEKALKESEAHRARERTFTEQLSAAVKESDDAQNRLAALRADRSRTDRQLRDARSAITAALNRQQRPAAPACLRAADATFTALGGCAEEYRSMAHRYGECLAGMQMIEKTWNAARDMCR